MKPSELRLNNRVLHRGTFERYIVGIFEKSVYLNFKCNEGDIWEAEYSDISPIPLDAEWLERFGFTKFKNSDSLFLLKYYTNGSDLSKYLTIEIPENTLTITHQFMGKEKEIYIHGIDYVHSLQNFFYAINGGTELTKKEI